MRPSFISEWEWEESCEYLNRMFSSWSLVENEQNKYGSWFKVKGDNCIIYRSKDYRGDIETSFESSSLPKLESFSTYEFREFIGEQPIHFCDWYRELNWFESHIDLIKHCCSPPIFKALRKISTKYAYASTSLLNEFGLIKPISFNELDSEAFVLTISKELPRPVQSTLWRMASTVVSMLGPDRQIVRADWKNETCSVQVDDRHFSVAAEVFPHHSTVKLRSLSESDLPWIEMSWLHEYATVLGYSFEDQLFTLRSHVDLFRQYHSSKKYQRLVARILKARGLMEEFRQVVFNPALEPSI